MSSAPNIHADHDHGVGPGQLTEVSEGVFAWIQPDGSWWINNCGALVGKDGVVTIDTCATERRTRMFLDAISDVTAAPVRTLINTHHHGDHTHGNGMLPAATIIAHRRCRELILESGLPRLDAIWPGVDWGNLILAPPFVTFDENLTVWSISRADRSRSNCATSVPHTRPTMWSRICRSGRSCSPAISCSTAGRHSS